MYAYLYIYVHIYKQTVLIPCLFYNWKKMWTLVVKWKINRFHSVNARIFTMESTSFIKYTLIIYVILVKYALST